MVNKFEAFGIAVSIGAMVLALWFIQLDRTNETLSEVVEGTQSAAVVVGDSENKRAAVADAVIEASDLRGNLQKLIVDDIMIGEGPEVAEGDTVSVHYIGTLQNGQQFDNSYLKGAPFTFTVGEGKVIAGWEEGILGMKVGGQRVLVIPSDLAYGDRAVGPIPAGATLVFAIELVSIE